MVDAFANLALETLRDLLVEETRLFLRVGGDVKKVKTELETIHAMLMRADRERSDSPTLKDYVAKLEKLAFKAETLLETYAVKVESNKEGKRSLKEKLQGYICIMRECCSVHHIAKQAPDILSHLADLTNNMKSEFGQHCRQSSSDNEDLLRYEYAHTVEPHFVGKEKDIEDIVSMVKDETITSRRVIKIYGMGGLGKTTLARKIYNHADLKSYDARAWVCITQQFQPHAVLGKILKHLHKNDKKIDEKNDKKIDKMKVSDLVEEIHSFLQRQEKCLIVVDDIWENDHWRIIKKAFPVNCKVLLTTRNETIANQECHSYKLECLTEDEGWELLQKIANPVETDLKDIGRQIVLKCGCLPLAISVIGGILKAEHTLAEWQKVNEKMDSILSHAGEDRRVNEVLDLSYNALPYYLKPCFLYLACFPEDTQIETEILYLLWMAEGLISHLEQRDNETLRDVAERYLSELAMRCMVQVWKGEACNSPHKKFDSCRLHDLMHDLCTSKAKNEDILKRIEISKYQNGIPSSSRLAIINDVDSDTPRLDWLEKLKGLRSFMLLGGRQSFQLEASKINFERSQSLRILVLDHCDFKGDKLPSKVSKLIHLRYLSLRFSRVRELPRFVCGMPYLQTLDFRVWSVIRLPNEIGKMKRLKHLYLPGRLKVIGGEKLRLDGLEALETLDGIDSRTACIEDIPKLISLRELRVAILDMDSLSALALFRSNPRCRLREIYLVVESCDLGSEIGRDVFKNVLMSPSLVTLSVIECDVGGGFPHYKQGMCQNLVELRVRIGDMDSLSALALFMSNPRCRLREIYLRVESCEIGRDVFKNVLMSPSLVTLDVIKCDVGGGFPHYEQGMCQNLVRLTVDNCEVGRDVFKNVLMSPSLVTLTLFKCDVGGGFPHYEQGMCQNLVILNVRECEVGGDTMEELGNYPMLQSLYLTKGRVELGKTGTLTCRSNSFPQLKSLGLWGCSYLHEWQVEEGAMPKLTELWIWGCSSLKKVPDGLRFISTLQTLQIFGMPKEFNERVRGQDYATLSHVPSLRIDHILV